MSKFIELTNSSGDRVLINVDNVLDVYCNSDGEGIVTLGSQGSGEYYYKVPDYNSVKAKIMEAAT